MTRNSMDSTTPPARRGSALAVAAAWAVVVLPAAWGITQTVRTSLRLFVPAKTTVTPAPHPGATTFPSNSGAVAAP